MSRLSHTRFAVFPLPSCCVSSPLWEYRRTATDDKYNTTVDFFLSFPRFVHTLFHQTKWLTPKLTVNSFFRKLFFIVRKPLRQNRTTVKKFIRMQNPFLTFFLVCDWSRKEKIYSSVLDCSPACLTNLNFRQLWTTLTALRWWEDGLNTFLVHTPVSRSVHNTN